MADLRPTSVSTHLTTSNDMTSNGYINNVVLDPSKKILLSDGTTMSILNPIVDNNKFRILLSARISYDASKNIVEISKYTDPAISVTFGTNKVGTEEWYTFMQINNIDAISNLDITNSGTSGYPAIHATQAAFRNHNVGINIIDTVRINKYEVEVTTTRKSWIEVLTSWSRYETNSAVMPRFDVPSDYTFSAAYDNYVHYTEDVRRKTNPLGGIEVIGSICNRLRFSLPNLKSPGAAKYTPVVSSVVIFTNTTSLTPRWFASIDGSGRIIDNRIRFYGTTSGNVGGTQTKASLNPINCALEPDGKYYIVNADLTKGAVLPNGKYISEVGVNGNVNLVTMTGIETYTNGAFVSRSGIAAFKFNS